MADAPGNGMHVHQSLMDPRRQQRVFRRERPVGLQPSDVAKRYIAGLLKYAPEFCVITNQYVNSYKRLTSGNDAPTYLAGRSATDRRSFACPVTARIAKTPAACELRSPDPAANPYLAFAVMLAAGLAGIEEELELQPPPRRGSHPASRARSCATGASARCPSRSARRSRPSRKASLCARRSAITSTDYIVSAKRGVERVPGRGLDPWEIERCLAVL